MIDRRHGLNVGPWRWCARRSADARFSSFSTGEPVSDPRISTPRPISAPVGTVTGSLEAPTTTSLPLIASPPISAEEAAPDEAVASIGSAGERLQRGNGGLRVAGVDVVVGAEPAAELLLLCARPADGFVIDERVRHREAA